ncbi:baseplate J/gp47 family protein [Azospirillum sp. TSO22-1]|uniref:baseplate J/gp47 family protein n=1 Tax=Azospirillum sp. TSO22-1 TaxID=716789 RepID=UPI000D60E2A2|nr:baseplate J/gp47 family protein [Azospirillum sp. TSO22-1]PWC44269.1 hypothetical protein TSO221_18420 [Azospirillum sp. TSO22-1]
MPFQIKDFLSIVAGMVNHMRKTSPKVTDFNVGSVARTMIEAPAIEIDELYQQYLAGLVEGIPTAIYRSFDFPLLPAVPASGIVRFNAQPGRTAPVAIAVGTRVANASNVEYETVEAATIPVGQTSVDVLMTAGTAGPAGNALPGAIGQLVSPVDGVAGVTNPDALANGRGAETESERKLRFAEFIKSLARGTVGALAYAARLATVTDVSGTTVLERVARVAVEEEAGFVTLYVHNGAGSTSEQLVQAVKDIVEGYEDADGNLMPGYRPAGMRVDVVAMAERPVDVTIQAQIPAFYQTDDTRAQIAAALTGVIRATRSGGDLRPVNLINAVLSLETAQGAEIVTPTQVVGCPVGSVLVPGTLTVVWS